MLMSYIDTRLFWEGHPNHQLFLHIRSLNRRVLIHLIPSGSPGDVVHSILANCDYEAPIGSGRCCHLDG